MTENRLGPKPGGLSEEAKAGLHEAMTDASKPPEEHIERCAIHAGVPKYKYANGEWYCIWCVSAEAVSQLAECRQKLAAANARLASMEKELTESIELAEGQLASERLAGNIVKESYWRGELAALTRFVDSQREKA